MNNLPEVRLTAGGFRGRMGCGSFWKLLEMEDRKIFKDWHMCGIFIFKIFFLNEMVLEQIEF